MWMIKAFVTMSIFAPASFAQSRIKSAQEFYSECGAQCDPSSRFNRDKSDGSVYLAAQAIFPSDGAQHATLRTSTGEFPQKNQQVNIFLDVLEPLSDVTVYGRHMKQNFDGRYDLVGYFNPPNGSFGYFEKLSIFNSILVYAGQVSPESLLGESHLFDVVILEAKTGALIQQIFTTYFVAYVGQQNSRYYYHVDSAGVIFGGDGKRYVVVNGVFPAKEPMVVTLGIRGDGPGAVVPIPAGTSSGAYSVPFIQFEMPFGNSAAMGLPLTILFPESRTATTYIGLVLPETRNGQRVP